jgi:tetratricopeptide (TPR) repeat protein
MFGFATAAAASFFLVFDPNFLAHAGLVTTDTAVSFGLIATVYAFYLWVETRSLVYLVLTGAGVAITLLSKHSGVVIVPILSLLAIGDAFVQRGFRWAHWKIAARNLAAVAVIGILAYGMVWSGYALRFAARPSGERLPPLFVDRSRIGKLTLSIRQYHLFPEAYIEGLQRARILAKTQVMQMFLFGRVHSRTRWYFFPANMIVRYTAASIALIVLGGLGVKYLFPLHRRELLFLSVPFGVYLLSSMQARIPTGIRHTLPLLSFLLILAAAASIELASRIRWARYVLPCLLVLHAASSLHAYPNYLSYANEFFGGPANAYRSVPWVDLGGAFEQVKTYVDQHPDKPCFLATMFLVEARYYGVRCRQFGGYYSDPAPERANGIVILSSSFLSSSHALEGGMMEPFSRLTPKDRIAGSSMLVYEGDFDLRIAAGATETLNTRRDLADGKFTEALLHGRKAAEITPENAEARYQYCRALVANRITDQAPVECNVARALLFEGKYERIEPSDVVEARNIAAGLTEAVKARSALDDGKVEAALSHGRKAIELAPRTGTAHFEYCRALTASREYKLAEVQCSNARVFMSPKLKGFTLGAPAEWDRRDDIDALLTGVLFPRRE